MWRSTKYEESVDDIFRTRAAVGSHAAKPHIPFSYRLSALNHIRHILFWKPYSTRQNIHDFLRYPILPNFKS